MKISALFYWPRCFLPVISFNAGPVGGNREAIKARAKNSFEIRTSKEACLRATPVSQARLYSGSQPRSYYLSRDSGLASTRL